MTELMSADQMEAALLQIGTERYHHRHPFHALLHGGKLTKGQVQAWALNRFYYQSIIPMKDAAILARSVDPEFRRIWRQRIVDHDGMQGGEGGIERWLNLTDALSLDRRYVESGRGLLPITRFAVDAYLQFVRERSLLEAVASSLTEMFSPPLISERVTGLLANYNFISKESLAYFDKRLDQAPRDATFALNYVKQHARRPDQQHAVIEALIFKCNILWAQLDGLYYSYVEPGHVPPGAFTPAASAGSN